MAPRLAPLISFFLCSAIAFQAQQDPRKTAKDELNLGVAAYRGANYEEAIEHFSNAVRLDPELKVARLYLATAYAQEYVPGVDTPDNVANATRALEEYAEVLRLDPANVTATKGIAYLKMQLKDFDGAREEYKRLIDLDGKDPEASYALGVMDWSMAYRDIQAEKAKLKSESVFALIQSAGCQELRTKKLADVEDGIAMLTQAIALRADYDDAMAYMNLLYRLRADLECGDRTAFKADIRTADEWADRAMAARKKKAEAQEHESTQTH